MATEIKWHSCTIDRKTNIPTIKMTIDGQYMELNFAPVDFVEVVRCKDCKHRKKWTTTGQFCCFHETSGMAVGVDLRDDDFCSYGERKDNG